MATKRFRADPGEHMCEIFFCDRRRERHCCYFCKGKDNCKNACLNTPGACGKDFIQGGKEN